LIVHEVDLDLDVCIVLVHGVDGDEAAVLDSEDMHVAQSLQVVLVVGHAGREPRIKADHEQGDRQVVGFCIL